MDHRSNYLGRFPKGITACQRPKMTNHRGRTWDQCTVIMPDGSEQTGYYDTTWGEYFYFPCADGRWRKGNFDFDTGKSRYVITPDLREKSNG